jgi:hypothetical protein
MVDAMAGAPPDGPSHGKGRDGCHHAEDTRGGAPDSGPGDGAQPNEAPRGDGESETIPPCPNGLGREATSSQASARNFLEPAPEEEARAVTDEITEA